MLLAQFAVEPGVRDKVRDYAVAKALTLTEAYRRMLLAGLERLTTD